MTIEVFHLTVARDATDDRNVQKTYYDIIMQANSAAIQAVFEGREEGVGTKGLSYELVAEVDTDDAEVAFSLTNHLDSPWTANDGVKKMGATSARSTSVGDVMRVNSGQYFYVAPIGFRPIDLNTEEGERPQAVEHSPRC